MGQVEALKRQGQRLTGRLADVEQAAARAIAAHDLGKAFYGCAIYAEDRKRPAELAVLHETSVNTSADHQEFVVQNLTRRRISKSGTSVGQALEEGKSGLYPSRMADHDCLNIIGQTPQSRFVLQLAFDKGAAIEIKNPENMLNIGGLQLSVSESMATLLRDYRDDLSDKMDLEPPTQPNGVLLFSDISGYKKIIESDGQTLAYKMTDRLLQDITAIAQKYGGKVIREEGDGIWSGFSQLDERALQAAKEIEVAFQNLRNGDLSAAVKQSHIRTMIASGYMEPALEGDIFNPSLRYNSLAFLSARVMSESAPRGRDVIALSPQAGDILGGFYSDKLIARKVKSTYTPQMLELTH